MDCIFCKYIYPELSAEECPVCNGKGNIFQPARMMDRETSQQFVFDELINILIHFNEKNIHHLDTAPLDVEEANRLKQALIRMIQFIEIYGFDLKATLRDLVHALDKMGE